MKKSKIGLWMIGSLCEYNLRMNGSCIMTILRIALKDGRQRKSSQMGKACHLRCVEEEVALDGTIHRFLGHGQWPLHMVRGLEGNGLEFW